MIMDVLPVTGQVDPSQYVLPWDTVFESLALVILLAFIVERVLAQFFETPRFIAYIERLKEQEKYSPKPLFASIISILITVIYKVDILAILVGLPQVSVMGCVVTGLLVAGGSKASIKLFRDFLDIKSNAYRESETRKKPTTNPAENNPDASTPASATPPPKPKSKSKSKPKPKPKPKPPPTNVG